MDLYSGRYKKEDDVKSDEKILGRWFVTELHHVFIGDIYTNKIFGTKTYIGPNSKYTDDAD